jgi:DnaA family protein
VKQLPLPIRLDEAATLENYIPGRNASALYFLQGFLDKPEELQAYLWAHGARGKSHLLQAMCQQASRQQLQATYLPMAELAGLGGGMLEGLERLQLVAIDDLQQVTPDPAWAEALFHLINRCRSSGCKLLLASTDSPQSIDVALPDLASRLLWGPVFHLDPLADADLLSFILRRSRQCGLEMPAEVAHYLVKHAPRDIRWLEELIEKLDQETLARMRRVTVPLVKEVMAQE